MVRIKKSIDIRAQPEAVFALVTDMERRLGLDPNVETAWVTKETDGPPRVGTVFHVHIRTPDQEVDYRARCTAFEPDHLLETLSLTGRPFGMRVTVEAIPEGTHLTHEEWFSIMEPEPEPRPKPKGVLANLAAAFASGLSGRTIEDRRMHEAGLQADLGRRLEQWLKATKSYLEKQGSAREDS